MSVNMMILLIAVITVALGGVMAAAKFIFPQRQAVSEAEDSAPRSSMVIVMILGLVVLMVGAVVLLLFIGKG